MFRLSNISILLSNLSTKTTLYKLRMINSWPNYWKFHKKEMTSPELVPSEYHMGVQGGGGGVLGRRYTNRTQNTQTSEKNIKDHS